MDYRIDSNFNQTLVPENKVYTHAEYEYYIDGRNVKYVSEFISIIDVPYRRYKLR